MCAVDYFELPEMHLAWPAASLCLLSALCLFVELLRGKEGAMQISRHRLRSRTFAGWSFPVLYALRGHPRQTGRVYWC